MTECEERTGKLTRRPVADLSHMTTHRVLNHTKFLQVSVTGRVRLRRHKKFRWVWD